MIEAFLAGLVIGAWIFGVGFGLGWYLRKRTDLRSRREVLERRGVEL